MEIKISQCDHQKGDILKQEVPINKLTQMTPISFIQPMVGGHVYHFFLIFFFLKQGP